MNTNDPSRVSVRLLEKEYVVSCKHEERADLLDSAEYLNGKMREIRDSGKVVGLDRIAVMAALNLAHEVLKNRGRGELAGDVGLRLRNMRERVETVLANKGRQLEL
jgi:cell division protein ZapA